MRVGHQIDTRTGRRIDSHHPRIGQRITKGVAAPSTLRPYVVDERRWRQQLIGGGADFPEQVVG